MADGTVTINAEMNEKGIEVGVRDIEASVKRMAATVKDADEKTRIAIQKQVNSVLKLNNQYSQQTQKIVSLRQRLKELSGQKIETEEYKRLGKEIDNIYEKAAKLESELLEWSKMGIPDDSGGFKEKEKELQEMLGTIESLEEKQKEMRKSRTAYVNPRSLSEYQNTASRLTIEEMRLDDMNNRLATSFASVKEKVRECGGAVDEVGSKVPALQKLQNALEKLSPKLAQNGMKQLKSSMKSLIRTVEKLSMKLLKLSASSIAGGIRKISSGIFGIHKSANKSTSSLGTMTKAIQTLLKYSIGVRSLYVLMNKLRSAAVEGFQNLAQYSSTTNRSISMLQSALTQLKNALATAFNPILTVAAPVLTKFINLLSQAFTYVGMFFGALTGQKTFTKAVAVQQDYAASLDQTANSAKKAEKALEGYLSPLDEINNYDDGSDSSSTDGTGGGYAGPTPDQMFEEVPIKNSIKGIADKIRKLIRQEDWEGLGKFMAQCINKGLKHVYDAISWKKVGPKITEFCDAFTKTFNSLIDNIDWDLLGRTVGAGITTLLRTFNRLTDPATGINFKRLGSGISQGLRGMIDEVPWRELGNALGNKFMIAWRMFDGFVQDMARKNDAGITGWQELGNAVAEALNGIFDKVNFSDIAEALTTGINGAFESLAQFTEDFDWDEVAENIGNGIATFIQDFKWKENGKALGDFLSHLCTALTDTLTPDTFYDLGKGIGDFLGQLPWGTLLKTAAKLLIDGFAGIFTGLDESGTAGKIVAFIGKAFLAIKIGQITGINSFVGALVAKIGEKLLATKSVSALAGSLSGLVSEAFSSLTSLAGVSGLIVGVGVAATYATSKLAGMVETMQGGNGVGTTFGNTMDNFIQTLQQRGDIISGSATEIWDLKESLEKEGMTAEEKAAATQKIIDKLSEMGVTSGQAEQAFENLRQKGLITDDMFDILSESIKTLGTDTTNMAQNIDLGSQKASDAYDDLRIVIGNLTNQMHLGTDEQGQLLNALERTVDSGGTAQDAYNNIITAVKDMGGNTETAAKIFAEVFPDAVQVTKTSIDENIVGAQQTVTSATGKMKTDAESNLSDLQKAAEDATSGVNTATVTNWGSSSEEVYKNVRQMKIDVSTGLGEMDKTVRSHFGSQYNIMTKKWEDAAKRITGSGQIIDEMKAAINRKMEGIARNMQSAGKNWGDNLANGLSDSATRGIEQTLNAIVRKVNDTINNINGALSNIERAFTFTYTYQNPVTGFTDRYTSWMNLSRVNSVPYLASGAVIPPRSEFLAVLGDQKTGNNIEAPENLLRKIVREESPQKQDGNTYNVSVTASGRKLLNIILEEGELQRSRNGGRNPFKLGEEW